MTIAVIGSANADLVISVPRRPGAGETLLGGDLVTLPGGKGANQAVAASLAGGRVAFIGCVGADGNGELLRTSLARHGVDTTGLNTVTKPTGTAVIFITPDGENSIVVSPGANLALTPERVTEHTSLWEDVTAVVLSLEIPPETVRIVAQTARTNGSRVIVNAAPAARLDSSVLECCDPLVVNEHEARQVLGLPTGKTAAFEELASRLCNAGARSVVITLGDAGAIVTERDGSQHRIPAFAVEVVDTTGAGDAFVGALASELARGSSLPDAARFASAMAALSVRSQGAQASYPNREAVARLLRAEAPGAGSA